MIFRSLILLIACTTQTIAFDGILPYETAQLKSQSGAGVASLLTNEATILNPASIVFTNQSTLFYEKSTFDVEDKSDQRTDSYKEGASEGFILVDSSSAVKGGVNYSYQRQAAGNKRTYGLSLAAPLSKRSAAGFIFSHNEEDSILNPGRIYTQVDFGYTNVLSEQLTFGFTIHDLTFVNPEYFKQTVGAFYTVNDFLDLMVDAGTGDLKNREKKSFNKWAAQLQAGKNFYMRYGRFYDRTIDYKGSSVGFSWIGPRLAFEYAVKNYEKIGQDTDTVFIEETFTESSFALTVLF